MTEAPRYASLRDLVRVLRQQRVLIAVVTLVFTLAALGLAIRQEERYAAEASLDFRDLSQDVGPVGNILAPAATPEQRAAVGAQSVTAEPVVEGVIDRLDLDTTVGAVQARVGAQAEARTNLVVVRATGPTAEEAQALANAFADEVKENEERRRRATVDRYIDEFSAQAGQLRGRRDPGSIGRRDQLLAQLASLRAVRDVGRPVEITRRASLPGAPEAPRVVLTTFVGALLGLALGIAAAFVRDSLDRRLRGGQEVQEALDLPLLGLVGDGSLGRVPVPGADVKGARGRLTEQDLEAFRIVRANLEFLDIDRELKTILVTSALPGEGKSTVSQALAWTHAAAGRRTLLVECDLRRPSQAFRLGLAPEPGLTDFLVGRAQPAEVLRTIALDNAPGANGATPEDGPRYVVVPAGAHVPRPAEVLASKRFEEFLAGVREAYDVVVVDSSPLLSVVDTLELVPRVDAVLLCVRASKTTREQARAGREALQRFPDRPTGVVVTGVRSGSEDDFGYYSYSYAYGKSA